MKIKDAKLKGLMLRYDASQLPNITIGCRNSEKHSRYFRQEYSGSVFIIRGISFIEAAQRKASKVKGMRDMNQARKSLLKKNKREMSDYSLVVTIISVSSLMAFITLPHEMVNLLKGAVDFLLK